MSTVPCWEEDGTLCAWLYDATNGNEVVSNSADWLIIRPLQIILILLVAWILVRLTRRWVRRWVERLIAPDHAQTVKRLERLGVSAPAILSGEIRDPRRETRARAISTVVAGALAVLIWTMAFILAVARAGLELGPFIAGAGIAGVALGFGAQSLVKDWIAGLFILLEDQYGIGDVVDLGEATGMVEYFSLRATRLRSLEGTVWHVPNGIVSRVGNLSQLWSVALLDVDVAYDTDLDTARTILHEAAAEVCQSDDFAESIVEPPEVLGVERLGADGITLRLIVKTTPGTQWALQRALREAVKRAFDDAGVVFPFPQRTTWLKVEPDQQ